MGIEVAATKPHVVFVPYPAQGHINPALAFAKCLASKGLLVTLITTTTVADSAKFSDDCSPVTVDCISDGSELAYGLIASNVYFLWIVRSSEVDKLPQDFTCEKGLIVEWCHQPEVLAHRAVACFVTHCGWNSTLEALSNGVPLVAMAQWVDQNTNAKFVEDVWGVGIGVERGENGIAGREEIAASIKQVVEGDEGIELKRNARRWKELAGEAVQNGGTSANNIDDFVSKLIFADGDNISQTSPLPKSV